jgi:hypothetical protein
VNRLDALLCREDSDSSAYIRPDVKVTPSERSSVFEKKLDFLCRHGSGKTACNRLDARATPSGRGLNMEMHEARYGNAVPLFTIRTQTLFASV